MTGNPVSPVALEVWQLRLREVMEDRTARDLPVTEDALIADMVTRHGRDPVIGPMVAVLRHGPPPREVGEKFRAQIREVVVARVASGLPVDVAVVADAVEERHGPDPNAVDPLVVTMARRGLEKEVGEVLAELREADAGG